jgi:cation diffusion facilitator family transporter
MNFAMRLSFIVGILMLVIKTYAYFKTGSAAIFSDAAESIIHVFAVGFAAFSMWLSLKPADENHPYGHEKINYFSAGFEGGMIIIAACFIIYESIQKMIFGFEIENVNQGIFFVFLAALINLLLGLYLVLKGKKYSSLILEANGKHILTDCYTSVGVIISLILVKVTDIPIFDPLVAILIGLNILWTGFKLFKESVRGLMDQVDPSTQKKITDFLKEEGSVKNFSFHKLRHRQAGNKLFVEFDLLFDEDISLKEAHEKACEIEALLKEKLGCPSDVITHLEPKLSHDDIHKKYGLLDNI